MSCSRAARQAGSRIAQLLPSLPSLPPRVHPALACRKVTLSVGHYARVLPLHSTLGAPRVSIDPATYLPPPLRKQAVGWYPEWGKVSGGGSEAVLLVWRWCVPAVGKRKGAAGGIGQQEARVPWCCTPPWRRLWVRQLQRVSWSGYGGQASSC